MYYYLFIYFAFGRRRHYRSEPAILSSPPSAPAMSRRLFFLDSDSSSSGGSSSNSTVNDTSIILPYQGVCWSLHSVDIFWFTSSIDIGLANALFGLCSLITFCVVLYVVYKNHRRARQAASAVAKNKQQQQQSSHTADNSFAAEEKSNDHSTSARSRSFSNSSWLGMTTFSPFSTTNNYEAVSFSSYLTFLKWSGFWVRRNKNK